MFGSIVKTIILTIFTLIIINFLIEHTKSLWYIPKHCNYDASYKKINNLINNLPDTDNHPIIPEEINSNLTDSIKSMEKELNEYITNIT